MIRLTTPLAHSEFANLVRMRRLLNSGAKTLTDAQVSEYWRLYDKTVSGVIAAAMVAAEDYYTAVKSDSQRLEVVHG